MKAYKVISILCLLPLAIFLIPSGWLPRFHVPERVGSWLVPATIGAIFTTMGLLKVYGWKKGIVGGGGKPVSCRLLGRCPSWSKQLNIALIMVFLGVGIVNLGICFITLLKQ